jgi:rhamnosyltransferase
LERNAVDLPRALRIIEAKSDYDTGMIYKNIIYRAELRTLNTNAALLSVLPDTPLKTVRPEHDYGRLAICAHIYYVDMMDEILSYTDNIPVSYDFIATTDTLEKKAEIERITAKHPKIKNTKVLVVERNRGRDMSSLFITCKDILLSGDYSLVCRVHTKKTPQVFAARGNLFKRHMFDNLLNSEGYVINVLNMFHDNPFIGLALPPLIHISYGTLGHSWFVNRKRAEEIASEMDLKVCLDSTTPVSAYGTMFWFRPEALKKLFDCDWKWDDFNPEPHHVDGSLAHVLERLIPYVAQDAGFTTRHIMSPHQAAQNYVWLEYKLERLASALPTADFGKQFALLRGLTGNRTSPPLLPGRAFREFSRAVGRSVRKRIGLQAKKKNKLR